METTQFVIRDYLKADEYFHYARKYLPHSPPPRLHHHDYYECFWLEQGTVLHWINGAQHQLEPGQLAFIRPNDTHGFQALGEERCRLINISFRPDIADHLIGRYRDDFADRFFWSIAHEPEIHRLNATQQSMLVRLARDLEVCPSSKLASIESFLLGIMTRLYDVLSIDAEQIPAWLVAACRAARAPEVFRLGAAGFVEASGHGHEHVCRSTRQYLGMTPSAYINRMRMDYAARLLAGSNEGIAEIAGECGLDNVSHFYDLFKKRFGMTPKSYRKRYRVDLV